MLLLFKTFSGLVYHAKFKLFLLISSFVFLLNSLAILQYVRESNLNKITESATIRMLDVGQGDSFKIELPGLQTILIDTGDDFNKFREAMDVSDSDLIYQIKPTDLVGKSYRKISDFLNKYFFSYSRKTIDLVIVTHDDSDHVGVLEQISKTYKIGAILVSPLRYTYIDKLLKSDEQIKVLPVAVKGSRIHLGDNKLKTINGYANLGAEINFLYPDINFIRNSIEENKRSANEDSLIFELEINTKFGKSITALFTGDAGIKEENKIIENLKGMNYKIDILKVGHHGSKNSTSHNLLNRLKPKFALVSAGKKNSYGHPHKQVLNNLKSFISEDLILRTDQCGTLDIQINKNGTLRYRSCDL